MNNKQIAFASVWSRYMPAIRILVKKAVAAAQVITINQSDIERAVGIKKSGYRFSINFIKDKPELLHSNNDIAQAFITALTEDETIREYLRNNNYTFSFNSKYQLQIKTSLAQKEVIHPYVQETVAG
ncbi:MAG TPA: hypothetical protein VFW07_12865 [Parafilimonas sp.]|nr:hypothetical protein [Parafilimonas sp.]